MEGCEFIQEYDRDKWDKPRDPAAPFIESMEIHVEKPAAKVPANGKAGVGVRQQKNFNPRINADGDRAGCAELLPYPLRW